MKLDRSLSKAWRSYSHLDYEKATWQLKDILDSTPSAEGHALLALCLIPQNRMLAARVEAQRGVAEDRRSAFCHYAAAAVSEAIKHYDAARRHIELALELEPQSTAYQIASLRLDRLQQGSDIQAPLKKLLSERPNDFAVFYALAEFYCDSSEWDQAYFYGDRALRLEGTNQRALMLMARICIQLNKYEEARSHIFWGLAANRKSADAMELLSQIETRSKPFLQGVRQLYMKLRQLGFDALVLAYSVLIFLGIAFGLPLTELFDASMEQSNDKWTFFAVGFGGFVAPLVLYGVLYGAIRHLCKRKEKCWIEKLTPLI
ncbi:CDC27 family protein [Hahella aquimaris]|uniref:tetratricopeptide repeat protein n=1 Tax=Hahella sp. HNIBRBA332 TaxID=3015983 RepID=UPI00273B3BB1|nr:CDC27 family protein [Hahella sp. HNIBRBA332]WLQ12534.1 CDC27 family protein [Hahella sp. HNIBRBA332]